ncbi:MAG: PGF-CTERM sorting domain-containing protein [Archaeoglobaceae archaeon]
MPISPPTPYPCDTQETNLEKNGTESIEGTPETDPDKRANKSSNGAPGFEALFTISGVVAAAYLVRRL